MACGMEERILEELARLKPGSTLCPGELARRLGTTLAMLRPAYADLAARGKIRVTQRGRPADLRTLCGPFRVGPVRGEDDAPLVR
jgi:DNA-binding FadR family transcriptional regulator